MRTANSGIKTRRLSWSWEVCTWMMRRLTDCQETIALIRECRLVLKLFFQLQVLAVIELGISDVSEGGVWDNVTKKVAYCDRGLSEWSASIMMRHRSPGWWFEARTGPARSFSQCVWQFHQNVSGVVIGRNRSRTPSFTSFVVQNSWRLHGLCTIWKVLEASSVCSNLVLSLNRKERCFSAYSAL